MIKKQWTTNFSKKFFNELSTKHGFWITLTNSPTLNYNSLKQKVMTISKKLNTAFTIGIIFLGLQMSSTANQFNGLLPLTRDGFETGDWRNFRPHYAGSATDWIRPNFSIIGTDPISGNYSLRWMSDNRQQDWWMLSNAFYLAKPVTVAIDFRLGGKGTEFEAGLVLMASKDEFAGIKVSNQNAELFKNGNTTIGQTGKALNLSPGKIYTLSVTMLDDNNFRASVAEKNSNTALASFESYSFISPEAVSLYVSTGAGSEVVIDFDNLVVDAAPYVVKAGEYVRSPQFVVLPRLPDVPQDQGNWVGGQSSMLDDGKFKMWYRIRDNQVRGRGYGFAQSTDGVNWEKYENNPIFLHHPDYQSNEKISVLKVDGLYRAWYAVDTGNNRWYTAYATSKDGVNWEQHGLVIDETYCKDAVVIYLDGTYYLYSIKDDTRIGVYTSSNGVDFINQNTIEIGVHAHVAAFYEKSSGLFHLYSTAGYNGVNHATSENGIDFGLFTNVMNPSTVGLDDWVQAGVTYLSFITDAHGHVADASALPFYYQARNHWDNNIPGWRYHGDERVVLGGKYEGIYLGIPTQINPGQVYKYESFPFMVPRADGLSIAALRPVRVTVNSYNPKDELVASGKLEALTGFPRRTQVQFKAEKLLPGKGYQLFIENEKMGEAQADKYGVILFTIPVQQDGQKNFRLQRK